MQFVRFSYYQTTNLIAPCGVVWCGAILLAVQCDYTILRVVLVQFLRFMRFIRFSKHPY